MKLTAFFQKVVHAIEAAEARPQPKQARAHRRGGDGFQVTRRPPVDLGKQAAASTAADGAYVTSLYRDLLGREPDADGFKAHMNGLAHGMSRDEIRQVFLNSPEYRAKVAADNTPSTPAPGPVVEPSTPAPAAPETSTDQLKRLIAADINTASGGTRQATQADYDYWLPKLQSPCDSGFVTSGQMTGVEYYHRRMLGWQAGGSDAAIAGPYAGDGQEHGPVPSATDVVGPLVTDAPPTPAPVTLPTPGTYANSTDQLKALIDADARITSGGTRGASQADYDYWLPKLQSPCDSGFVTSGQMTGVEYYHRRMLGWQAGGSDAPSYGPYAGGVENGPVPAATDLVGPLL